MQYNYTKEDILDKAREHDVRFIRLQFIDIFGVFKNIAITIDELPRALEGRMSFDSSVVEGLVSNRTRDIYLLPDPSTFAIFPWRPREGAVARLICDTVTPQGEPFSACSRYVLKQVLKNAKGLGYEPHFGAEVDFFLFCLDQQGKPTVITHDQAGYCDLTPLDLGENARRDMVLTLQEMGFDISSSHHEIAPGQHQIFLKQDNALAMADNIATFRFVVRTIAQRHGLYASFMPKPFAHLNGSGMHLHLSLFAENQNVFSLLGQSMRLSDGAGWFIAGLIEHAAALTALANPLVNSYKRLAFSELAPALAGWSYSNRNTMLRVPTQQELQTRIILRSPDPSSNPYLVIAVALASGLDGIVHQSEAPPVLDDFISAKTGMQVQQKMKRLPRNLFEALFALSQDKFVCGVIGEQITGLFRKVKEAEWERYESQVHQWELDEYLTNF